MKYLFTKHRFIRHLPIYPIIYPTFIFILLLDIWTEFYHRIAFPCYGLPYIKRRHYIKIDRHKLKYLNPMQKLNCMYCGYANGVMQYMMKILAETEKYWCGIQHKRDNDFSPPEHHKDFIPYGNKEAYMTEFENNKTRMI
jgi:hypothetical protein